MSQTKGNKPDPTADLQEGVERPAAEEGIRRVGSAAATIALDGQEVTMRGDLEQISLSDIFQTLAMSKMEGVLRICNLLQQRFLFFRDGLVKDLPPRREKARRLGQLLVRAGMLEPDQLHEALQLQKEERKPLGRLLIEQGYVTQDDVEAVGRYQAAEDMYSLFTWRQGSFEFYRGPCSDPQVQAKLSVTPAFEVHSVLLEVARRADEWQLLLETLHSVDEVVERVTDDYDPESLSPDVQSTIGVIDGTRCIQEVSDETTLGLFDCVRAIKELHDLGIVALAPPEQMLAAAEDQHYRGDVKRAVVTLRTLLERGEELDTDTVVRLAQLMQRCGESRIAGACLVDVARRCEEAEEALALAREARRLAPRSSEVLEFLRDVLVDVGGEPEELHEVATALVESLADQGRTEEALESLEELLAALPEEPVLLNQKALLLHRVDRTEDALETLLRLARVFRNQGRPDRVRAVYEQVLKIDHRNKDAQSGLRALRSRKTSRQLRALAALGLVAIGALLTNWLPGTHDETDRVEWICARIRETIDRGDTGAALNMVNAAVADLGADERLETLRRLIAERVEAARAAERLRVRRRRLAEAADHFEKGALADALGIYGEIAADQAGKEEIRKILKTRIGTLLRELEEYAKKLPSLVPEAPSILQSELDRRKILAGLERDFSDSGLRKARGVLEVRDHEVLESFLGTTQRDRLAQTAAKVVDIYRTARTRRKEYRESLQRTAIAKRLNPVFEAALRHENDHEFAKALAAYRKLSREHPEEDELKAHFRERVQYYTGLLQSLREIEEATGAGDFETARARLRAARERYADLPVDRLVRLPLRVDTSPSGARVRLGGEDVGLAPVLTTFQPAAKTVLRVSLEGFEPQEATVHGDAVGRMRFVLVKAPDWTLAAGGSIQHRAAFDFSGRAFLAHRSGTIFAVDLAKGRKIWSLPTRDMSGLLPTPVVDGSRILVASLDGTLRCLEAATGKPVWKRTGLPCEGAPTRVGETLVLGTADGRAVGVRTPTGEILYSVQLPGPVRRSITSLEDSIVVGTANGFVLRLRVGDGKTIWKRRIGRTMAAPPKTGAGLVIATSDEGTLVAMASDDGRALWRRDGLGELLLRPEIAWSRVVVAQHTRLLTFDLATGRSGPTFETGSELSSAPVFAGGKLFVGDRQGVVTVLEPRHLELAYVIRGEGRVTAPVVVTTGGRVVVGFESGQLQGFDSLP